jgi:cytochrome oxidase assembly protein ShyY1
VSFRAPSWLLLPLIVVAVVTLVALGFWQWGRYWDKQDLEAQYDARTDAPPLEFGAATALTPEEVDFHRVSLDGRWDSEHVLAITSRFRDGIRGEELVVPLVAGDGTAVLVDRGWYPLEEREAVLAALSSEETTHVEGLARWAEDGGGRQTTEGGWNRFDPATMAATLPYAAEPWGVIEGEERTDSVLPSSADAYPLGGWVRYDNTVPHFEYALTWWGLAGVLVVTAVARFALRRGRETEDRAESTPATDVP